jgi:hypothetical protein
VSPWWVTKSGRLRGYRGLSAGGDPHGVHRGDPREVPKRVPPCALPGGSPSVIPHGGPPAVYPGVVSHVGSTGGSQRSALRGKYPRENPHWWSPSCGHPLSSPVGSPSVSRHGTSPGVYRSSPLWGSPGRSTGSDPTGFPTGWVPRGGPPVECPAGFPTGVPRGIP